MGGDLGLGGNTLSGGGVGSDGDGGEVEVKTENLQAGSGCWVNAAHNL